MERKKNTKKNRDKRGDPGIDGGGGRNHEDKGQFKEPMGFVPQAI